jgi:phosphoribosylamine-glycine ligase
MRSIVYFTSRAPSKIGEDIIAAGYEVFEALEISEVMHLCEHEKIDMVVIASDIEDQDMVEAQLRRITIKMKPGSTAAVGLEFQSSYASRLVSATALDTWKARTATSRGINSPKCALLCPSGPRNSG